MMIISGESLNIIFPLFLYSVMEKREKMVMHWNLFGSDYNRSVTEAKLLCHLKYDSSDLL